MPTAQICANEKLLRHSFRHGGDFYKCPRVTRLQYCTWNIHDGSNAFRVDSDYYVIMTVKSRLTELHSDIVVQRTNSLGIGQLFDSASPSLMACCTRRCKSAFASD
ncbi:hypothetical protein NP493_297g01022 [Ridgeia piscesae]|uniref:Uncharacterized protein n=1 Tax=Ridgeia piscesae TaxID=27915 RepID=A0AAD9L728_RIDPI|nr:hypothetical protein NP493_297g01022 [Ridgeia piscesae]